MNGYVVGDGCVIDQGKGCKLHALGRLTTSDNVTRVAGCKCMGSTNWHQICGLGCLSAHQVCLH